MGKSKKLQKPYLPTYLNKTNIPLAQIRGSSTRIKRFETRPINRLSAEIHPKIEPANIEKVSQKAQDKAQDNSPKAKDRIFRLNQLIRLDSWAIMPANNAEIRVHPFRVRYF